METKYSLLLNLYKYVKGVSHFQHENFTTEAFVWLLRNDPKAASAFLGLIGKDNNITWDWEAHKVLKNGKIPDIYASRNAPDSTCEEKIIVEVKLSADLHENQLESYSKVTRNRTIVLLTMYKGQHTQKADYYLVWDDIYTAFNKIKGRSVFLEDFLCYLNYIIKPLTDINISLSSLMNFIKNPVSDESLEMKNILRKIFRKAANELDLTSTKIHIDNLDIYDVDVDGRLGINYGFTDVWYPSFFAGLFYKTYLCKFEHISEKYGMPFGVCICLDGYSLDAKTVRKITSSDYWKNYISCVREILKDDGWNVYDGFNESKKIGAKSPLKWYPILIWKKFKNVIDDIKNKSKNGKISTFQLSDEFYTIIKHLYEALIAPQEFKIMQEEIAKYK